MNTSEMWYNVTDINATEPLYFMQSINDGLMFGMLGNILLLVIFAVSFMAFIYYNNNPKLDMMFSSFIVAVLSVILRVWALVPDATPFFCWGLFAVSMMIVAFTK